MCIYIYMHAQAYIQELLCTRRKLRTAHVYRQTMSDQRKQSKPRYLRTPQCRNNSMLTYLVRLVPASNNIPDAPNLWSKKMEPNEDCVRGFMLETSKSNRKCIISMIYSYSY